MRILHTSDWHLGRFFHGFTLRDHQQQVLEWMIDLTRSEDVDVVVIAGDLYDRAIPPIEAIELFEMAVTELRGTGAAVIAIAGNHDSPVRVGPFEPLLSRLGVTVRGGTRHVGTPVEIQARDGGPDLIVYPIPYLEPELARHSLGDEDARTQEAVLRQALALVAADRTERGAHRSVLLAHAFVNGGAASESERPLSIGGADQVPVSMLDGFDYVALGHLHRPQSCVDRVRYSGSPIAYSFAEHDHDKSVTLVDLAPDGGIHVETRAVPPPRRLARISGEVQALLDDATLAWAEDCWVEATVTDEQPPLDPFQRLSARFAHLASLVAAPPKAHPDGPGSPVRTRDARTDLELALLFIASATGRATTDEERSELEAAMAQVRAAEVIA